MYLLALVLSTKCHNDVSPKLPKTGTCQKQNEFKPQMNSFAEKIIQITNKMSKNDDKT